MKRNLDIVREMLLAVERGDDPFNLSGYEQQDLLEHGRLLIEAELAEGCVAMFNARGEQYTGRVDLDRLTWKGHDFLDAARDDTLWKKAKEKVMKPGASFTIELVKEWLKSEIRARIGS